VRHPEHLRALLSTGEYLSTERGTCPVASRCDLPGLCGSAQLRLRDGDTSPRSNSPLALHPQQRVTFRPNQWKDMSCIQFPTLLLDFKLSQ